MRAPRRRPRLRVLCLAVARCHDCGDEIVTGLREPVCRRCVRLATLRQRLARQPGAIADRRGAIADRRGAVAIRRAGKP